MTKESEPPGRRSGNGDEDDRGGYEVSVHDGVIAVVDSVPDRSFNGIRQLVEDLRRDGHDLERLRVIHRDTYGVFCELRLRDGRLTRLRSLGPGVADLTEARRRLGELHQSDESGRRA